MYDEEVDILKSILIDDLVYIVVDYLGWSYCSDCDNFYDGDDFIDHDVCWTR